MGAGRAHDGPELEPLVAYLHLPRHASPHTRAVLEGHVRSFASREGYRLHRVLAGAETPPDGADPADHDGGASVRELLDCVQMAGIQKVLVVGPARQALLALHRVRGVSVLTLAQVRPPGETGSTRTRLAAPGVAARERKGGRDR